MRRRQAMTRKRKNALVCSEKDDVKKRKMGVSDVTPEKNYWLLKAEPNSRIEKGKDVKFSIEDLYECKKSPWDGVRNHEAKKHMRNMKVGDLGFFYHSNCTNPGIAGLLEVVTEAYPDYTAWDSTHPYYDPKSDNFHKWYMVDVGFVRRLSRFIPLREIKTYSTGPLSDMALLRRGRLSVSPVSAKEWDFIMKLETKQEES